MKRRDFLKRSAAVTGMAAWGGTMQTTAAAQAAANGRRQVRIGSPVFFSQDDPEAWAAEAVKQRNRAVYAPNVPLSDSARIKAFEQAAAKHDLVIAEVGRWCNLMDADAEKRSKNLQNVTEGLALADAMGARCCVDIAGTFATETWFGPHPKNVTEEFFDLAVENARKIVDAVKPKRAKFAYETMPWAIPDSPENYARLLKAVDRSGFGVHLDICNMVNSPQSFWNLTTMMNEAFDKLGPHIVSCHAKDLRWQVEYNIHFVECTLGEGVLDYRVYLDRLAGLPNDVPLMIEHMKDKADYDKCKDFLETLQNEA